MKIAKILIILGITGIISACSSTFKSNVSRFHELPQARGETVMIVPSDPAKNTSLEFVSYANIVGAELAKQGYVAAGDGDADLIVEIDYGVDDGKVMTRGYSFGYGYGYGGYGYGGYGYGFGLGHYSSYGYFGHFSPYYGFGHGGFGHGGFGYGGYGRGGERSYVSFTRKLSMTIRPNEAGRNNLFEGTVESTGRSNNLPKLMPHMVQAMFTNFPGTSGTTDKIVIELGDK